MFYEIGGFVSTRPTTAARVRTLPVRAPTPLIYRATTYAVTGRLPLPIDTLRKREFTRPNTPYVPNNSRDTVFTCGQGGEGDAIGDHGRGPPDLWGPGRRSAVDL